MVKPTSHRATRLAKISFDEFKLHNSNPRDAFESLSYFLFCRRFKLSNGIFRYKNQAGIETNPIDTDTGLTGFQSKFFDNLIDKVQLTDSLKTAKEKHPKLKRLIFYLNKEFSEGRGAISTDPQNKKAVEDEAKKLRVKIEWFVPSKFEISLNEPANLDLAQFYFGAADQFGFIRSGVNHNIQTLLQSDEYIDLPMTNRDKAIDKPVISIILKYVQKSFLITGHPGSGKVYLCIIYSESSVD